MNENCYFVENDSHIFFISQMYPLFSVLEFLDQNFSVDQDAPN